MSETAEAPTDFSDSAIQARWSNGFGEQPTETATETVVQETKPKETPKTENEVYIPDKFTGGAPKTDVAPDEEDMLTFDPKGQISHKHFKKLQDQSKARIEASDAEKAKFEAEIKELRGKYTDDYVPETFKQQLEQERKLREDRDTEIGKINAERTEAFREKFSNRLEGVKSQLKKASEELKLDDDMIPRLLGSGLKKRLDILSESDLGTGAIGHLTNLLDRHDEIEREKSDYLENWKVNLAKAQAEESKAADAQLAKDREYEDKVFERKLEGLRKTYAPLQKIEGDDKWNAMVEQHESEAKRFFQGKFTTEEYAELALAGVTAKSVYGMYKVVESKLIAAQEELQGLKAASPSVPSVGSKAHVTDESKLPIQKQWENAFDRITGAASNNGFGS